MSTRKKLLDRIKANYGKRVGYRKMYSEEFLSQMSDSEKLALRSKYLRHLSFFSGLLFLSVLALLGVLLIGSPSNDWNENYKTYKTEESRLSKEMDSIYGKGNWELGIYQTNMDAYRVKVKLSDGSVVEHYYRISGGNIYRLIPE